MKHHLFFLTLTLFSLLLAGCQEKASKKSSSSSNSLSCDGNSYYTTPGCGGYCQYYPTAVGCSGTTSGTGSCSGQAYWTTPGCVGYCQMNPSSSYCSGGSTTGGSANCSPPSSGQQKVCANYCTYYPSTSGCIVSNGAYVNCNYSPNAYGCPGSSTTINGNNYGNLYPQGVPADTCSAPYMPSGAGAAYETRKATMTVVGGSWYTPDQASSLYNTSSMLKTVAQAKTFFMTDSMVKVRFKTKPEPDSAGLTNVCYGRVTGSSIPGYTKLKFDVYVRGVTTSNSLTGEEYVGNYSADVNGCTSAIDLSYYKAQYPNGIVIKIANVMGNQGCSNYNYTTGFQNCTVWSAVRTRDCWSLDLEVSADGTKIFD